MKQGAIRVRKNTYDGSSMGTYKHQDLTISYDVVNVPSQCGMRILSSFGIYRQTDATDKSVSKAMAVQFRSTLRRYHKQGNHRVGKLIATAYVGSPLHRLLVDGGWEKSTTTKNPNSGNNITVFTLDIVPSNVVAVP